MIYSWFWFCCERHASQQEDKNHQHLEHNPLKSCYNQLDHLNPFAVYDDLDDSSGEDSTDEDRPDEGGLEYSTKDEIGINGGKEDYLAIYNGDYTDGQFSTAITTSFIYSTFIYSTTTCILPTLANMLN